MDKFNKMRVPIRASFTKIAKKLAETVDSKTEDADTIAVQIEHLENKWVQLEQIDKKILELMQADEKVNQESFNKEFESIDNYNDSYLDIKVRAERYLKNLERNIERVMKNENEITDIVVSKRKFKLPELELKKFSGDVKDWLAFWGQFKKIHEDPEIVSEDKYQYLIQSTVPGSRAREIVDSFPPTAENYEQAIDCLKSRFGREDILIELYIRELLGLVLNSASNFGNKFPLVKLYDKVETYLRSLKILGVTSDKCAYMLYPLVESCLPLDILRVWERSNLSAQNDKCNKLEALMLFLRNEIESEMKVNMAQCAFGFGSSRCDAAKVNKPERSPFARHNKTRAIAVVATGSELMSTSQINNECDVDTIACVFCEKSHGSYDCQNVVDLSYNERKSILIRKGACFKCLKRNHLAKNCKKRVKCSVCNRWHYAIMCPDKINDSLKSKDVQSNNSENSVLSNQTHPMNVVLQTLVVKINNRKKEIPIRALIDSGSQRSYATREIIDELGYEPIGEMKVTHTLFGGLQTQEETHQRYKINVTNPEHSYRCTFEVLDQGRICNEISRIPIGPWVHELEKRNIFLTDREDDKQCRDNQIHLLIGADIVGKLLTGRVFSCSSGPVAVHMRLGWTLIGKIPSKTNTNENTLSVTSLLTNELENLWRLDIIGISDTNINTSREEMQAETAEYFERTVARDHEGRYVVSLPWVREKEMLTTNRDIAERRLVTVKRKLEANGLLQEYGAIFSEWLKQNIIERARDGLQKSVHYLPHRPVIKEASSTTKIRPVFDASARKKGMFSLNGCLEKGINLVEVIPKLFNKFRKYEIGITSDIEKAFLQIGVREEDRDYLRFLWYDEDGKLVTYRHCRIVFGVTSSPYLLNATLSHHLSDVPEPLKNTAEQLKSSFYIDNCVTSFRNIQEMEKFVVESSMLLSSAQFNLRDWTTNVPCQLIDQPNKDEISVLGMNWNTDRDTLSCAFKDFELDEPITKRKVLSITNRVFDPIGFTCPVTLLPKLILQETWRLKLSWDEVLPDELASRFIKWMKRMSSLASIEIPRWLHFDQLRVEKSTLHIFCDACKTSYATCIFLRVEGEIDVTCHLIQARARVAPLKNISIPRLELLACNIGARLANTVVKDLGLENLERFYWTDATPALYWIKREANWAVFVSNRVKEIRSLSSSDTWRHIPGTLNPADFPSRGCTGDQLLRSEWWEGPDWLKKPAKEWPISEITPNFDIIDSEKKKTIIATVNSETECKNLFDRISSYKKILKVISWIYRFVKNSKLGPSQRISGRINVDEIKEAECVLLKSVQQTSFNGLEDKRLRVLEPLVDPKGLIRARTRILRREDAENFRFPIILPSDHSIVEKLIRTHHEMMNHAGVQFLISSLRENFWILKARRTIRKVIRSCVRCRKFDTSCIKTPIVPLPEERVRDAAVFEITGIDLTGPLILKGNKKTWIVIFTCAVFRAVHLELVWSLSTEGFLQAMRRFIARRGRPHIVYSDNGTNFTGTSNLFRGLNWKAILEETTVRRISWRYIPPSAPWWGGWWERLIGVLKRILRKVLGRASLDYEEMNTIICDCESVMNSRPLTYVSDDIQDLVPLTPSMFLQEMRESGVPDLDDLDTTSVNKRYAYRQRLRNDLRKRFRSEYLGQLRQNAKQVKNPTPINVGDVVVVSSDNTKRINWPLGKVLEVFRSKDGHVRLVKLKTQNGELLRPVARLCPLEINCTIESAHLRRSERLNRCKD